LGIAGLHELGDSTKYKYTTMKGFSGGLKFQDEEEYYNGESKEKVPSSSSTSKSQYQYSNQINKIIN